MIRVEQAKVADRASRAQAHTLRSGLTQEARRVRGLSRGGFLNVVQIGWLPDEEVQAFCKAAGADRMYHMHPDTDAAVDRLAAEAWVDDLIVLLWGHAGDRLAGTLRDVEQLLLKAEPARVVSVGGPQH